MTPKHPYEQLRYSVVLAALREELAWTRKQAEDALTDGRLPDWPHDLHSHRLWLAKDVLAFLDRVKQGDPLLLGKGGAGGGLTTA